MTPSVPLLNVANRLTILRLFLVPVFVWVLVRSEIATNQSNSLRTLATVIFLLASLTDFADGYLARRHGIETNFGVIADPIADKMLTGSALVWLSLQGLIWWWVTVVILVREVGITVLRFVVIKRGVIAASRAGKIKTVSQLVAISIYLMPLGDSRLLPAAIAMTVALVLTIGTGLDYIVHAYQNHKAIRNAGT